MTTVFEQELKIKAARQHRAGPIQTTADLPKIGEAREGQALDFKGTLSPNKATGKPKYVELAKDMAAMANARGGNIIVGAFESNEVLQKYDALDDDTAGRIISAYEDAASKFCVPSPIISASRIPFEHGCVVSIYVMPHLGNLMGVRLKLEKCDEYAAGDAYRFPLRIGSQTTFLNPASFPLPESRKIMLALAEIPPLAKVQLIYHTDRGGRHEPTHTFKGIDIVRLGFETNISSNPFWTPVDDVRSVIPQAHSVDGPRWKIKMKPDARWS